MEKPKPCSQKSPFLPPLDPDRTFSHGNSSKEEGGGGGSQADHREEEGGGTIMQKRGSRGEGGKKLRTNISRKRRKKGDQVGMEMEKFTCSAGGDVVVGTDKSRENL